MRWPDGFLWGTGASSTQCEGAAPASDWWRWEREGRAPISSDGNGFAERYDEDFALLAQLGLRHHRLSLEWARLEPIEGVHDLEAIERYRQVLTSARQRGIAPWACLHHFSLPAWFLDAGGFAELGTGLETWRRHVDFIAETFGDLVAGWQPINEINYYARAAYGGRGWPPGHDDAEEVAVVHQAMHLAAAEAALRLRETGSPTSSIFGLSPIITQDESEESAAFAQRLDSFYWQPGLGLQRDGVLRIPDRAVIERPDLAGAFDLFGFSYYAAMGVNKGRLNIHPPDAPISPLVYGIWADGVGLVLDRLSRELPDTPLLVAEYGIGTADDDERSRYLARGIEVVHDCIGRGVDVRGLFHWTAVDNYEWLHGYDLSFGIIDAARKVRPSAQILADEAIS